MNRRPIIRHLARTVAFATAAAALVTGATVAQPVEAADALPAGSLAQFVGYDQRDRFVKMESSLGRPLDRVVTMTDHRSPSAMRSSVWGQFIDRTAYLPGLSKRLDVTVTIPIAFGSGGSSAQVISQNLKKTASGAFDADYRIVAKNLIAAGYSDAVLRLGHEFDGTYYPWSSRDGNEQAYINAFRHVQSLFDRESSAFRFEWAGMNSTWRSYAQAAYPGAAYVDIIGLDTYYRAKSEITANEWARYEATLKAQRDFAISQGKPVSFPEWGRGFANTDGFVRLMHGWFAGLPAAGPGSLEYQAYYNPQRSRHAEDNHDLDSWPTVKQTYLRLFSTTSLATAPSQPAPPPPTPTTPPTTPPTAAPPAPSPQTPPAPTPPPPTTTPALPGSAPGIALAPRKASLELTWFHADAQRRNVRYRPAGTAGWTWVPNGAWNQVISGLRSGTRYEVQVRALTSGTWQPWMTAMATTN